MDSREPLTELYLRDCRERLDSSEHMDPIEWAERAPSLLAEIDRLRAEVERLTDVVASLRSNAAAEAEAHAMVERMLEADLGMVEPTEEPTEVVTAGIAYMGAYMKCECCDADIECGDRMAIWRDSNGRLIAFAHAGPCPADLWDIHWRTGATHGIIPGFLFEEAAAFGRRLRRRPVMQSVRLVRCKGPRRD